MSERAGRLLLASGRAADAQRMGRSLRHSAARLALLGGMLGALAPVARASSAATSDPSTNRPLSPATSAACQADPSGTACTSSALAEIDAARATEGVRPMVLPPGFPGMSAPVQLLNLANLERVDRGLAPVLGLSAALNRDARAAAAADRDPMPTHLYGTAATANWAGGYPSTLEADYVWMYDDGLGSANLDCTTFDRAGCWGHRRDILWPFSPPVLMGAGEAVGRYGESLAELFVGGDSHAGPDQPDAPVVRPSPRAGSGTAGPSARVDRTRRRGRRSRRRRHTRP